ncbi:hypothetical protein BDR22DRAFT_874048 [Usnea florida]
MNFSEPRCATTITTNNNGNTSLDLAHSLLTSIPHATTLSDFTRHLSAINHAAYLTLLPTRTPHETAFRRRETRRISTGPLGDAVIEASTLLFFNTFRLDTINEGDGYARELNGAIYEATGCMLRDIAAEEERYVENMGRLLGDMKGRWKRDLERTGSWHHTALTMGPSGIASAHALADFVANNNHHSPAPTSTTTTTNKTAYLSEIARHWRKWSGTGTAVREASLYEEVWCYVAGRALGGE